MCFPCVGEQRNDARDQFRFKQLFKMASETPKKCFLRAGSAKYMLQMLPVLLEACKSRDAALRQCAAFGVGILAQHRPDGFRPVAATAVSHLLAIIGAPDARCFSSTEFTPSSHKQADLVLGRRIVGAALAPGLPLTVVGVMSGPRGCRASRSSISQSFDEIPPLL